jgi:D-threonate/D-erythronate kinase
MSQVLVVADDLTGGNATGAMFARRGLRTVSVDPDPRHWDAVPADVVVVNTDTRRAPPTVAADLVARVVHDFRPPPQLLVKRVDTTLRGPVAAELAAALAARSAGCDRPLCAVAVPAYPGAGRTTVGGIHLVEGIPVADSPAGRDPFTPVPVSGVADLLTRGTSLPAAEVHVDVLSAGADATAARLAELWQRLRGTGAAPVLVLDAVTEAHLRTAAVAAARLAARGVDVVAVDSGPFGAALAEAMRLGPEAGPPAPVLLVVASLTERTALQLEHVRAALGAVLVDLHVSELQPSRMVDRLRAAVEDARPSGTVRAAGWRLLPEDRPDIARAGEVVTAMARAAHLALGGMTFQGVFASGGDMATGLLRRLGASGFAIEFAVQPLVVTGRLTGGRVPGLPFATKGGLIGNPDAVTESVLHLQSMPAPVLRPDANPGAPGPHTGSLVTPLQEVVP